MLVFELTISSYCWSNRSVLPKLRTKSSYCQIGRHKHNKIKECREQRIRLFNTMDAYSLFLLRLSALAYFLLPDLCVL
jgi:hypothetical protein